MDRLKEILESLGNNPSCLVTISYITDDRKTVKTECFANNFPVNDLTTARSEASRLIYEMQAEQEEGNVAEEDDELSNQVKGLLS